MDVLPVDQTNLRDDEANGLFRAAEHAARELKLPEAPQTESRTKASLINTAGPRPSADAYNKSRYSAQHLSKVNWHQHVIDVIDNRTYGH